MKRKNVILLYISIYLIVGVMYSKDIVGSDIFQKVLLYFGAVVLLSIIYPLLSFNYKNCRKRVYLTFRDLIKNYFVLLLLSNITNIYLNIVYNFNKWGVDYEGLAVSFIYFEVIVVLTMIFYVIGVIIFRIYSKRIELK